MRIADFLRGGSRSVELDLLDNLFLMADPERFDSTLASRVLYEFGTLSKALAADLHELERIKGVEGPIIAAMTLVASITQQSLRTQASAQPVINDWSALLAYLHVTMANLKSEQFRIMFLNCRFMIIRDEVLGYGTVDHAPAYPREVIKRALELGATGVVLVHNHPSGDPEPSRDDIYITRNIIEAGRHVSVKVIDHVIISASGYRSLREGGMLG
ncbi:JAB domain-containing protein [Polymorphobacter multimanifer]|uniref:DNA repair protein RadC n=1 Tax=Polymorphobacter multimanifer TaxID=1070431 RepID=A0A841LI97_9SPHN|nr:DNA repair protein RadC [Polymorphobacter multimanifer]MBB6229535.1 DNA repair protein RadC [Polymorphobacter multimanifer]